MQKIVGKKFDAKVREKFLQKQKHKKLEEYDMLPKKEDKKDASPKKDEGSKKEDSFGFNLATRIIDNLQLEVRNVHIRYEDSISNPAKPFSFGITIEELVGKSTNDKWETAWIENSRIIHKVYSFKKKNKKNKKIYNTFKIPLTGFII